MVRPTINSVKHVNQYTLAEVGPAAKTNLVIAKTVQGPDANLPSEVREGAVIKAVYLELWFLGTGQQPTTIFCFVEKITSEQGSGSFTALQNVFTYGNKANILEMHQGVVGDANTNPVPFWRGWIKIPKGKQRFRNGDELNISISSITEATQWCGLSIFKEYF